MDSNTNCTRRFFLQTIGTGAAAVGLSGCDTIPRMSETTDIKVNKDAMWMRRQKWEGMEIVKAVVIFGDRYLMVRHKTGVGWDFPGGLVKPEIHGQKNEQCTDLVKAITDYVHNQAVVQVIAGTSSLIAYGYCIDPVTDHTYMGYWLIAKAPSSFPPKPHPNLRNIIDAKWTALDDPKLGDCLRRRIDEYQTIKEGGTILLEPCYE